MLDSQTKHGWTVHLRDGHLAGVRHHLQSAGSRGDTLRRLRTSIRCTGRVRRLDAVVNVRGRSLVSLLPLRPSVKSFSDRA
ncbi:hypothetical protein LIA77_11917 [Sarocladium implicatum]|nr:hypothetical protein LIA77_11917 [Sarocladium implicatum]